MELGVKAGGARQTDSDVGMKESFCLQRAHALLSREGRANATADKSELQITSGISPKNSQF